MERKGKERKGKGKVREKEEHQRGMDVKGRTGKDKRTGREQEMKNCDEKEIF